MQGGMRRYPLRDQVFDAFFLFSSVFVRLSPGVKFLVLFIDLSVCFCGFNQIVGLI